jgi:hypothetical protein
MKSKMFLAGFFVLLVLPLTLMAQDAVPVEIDIDAVELILITGVGGFAVGTLTEMIKRALKASGVGAYAVSLVVSAAATVSYMVGTGWNTLLFVVYMALVFGASNGFYKLVRKPVQ